MSDPERSWWAQAAADTAHDLAVLEAMTAHGSPFVRALAEAARLASPENLRKIKATWPHLWHDYAWVNADVAEDRHV